MATFSIGQKARGAKEERRPTESKRYHKLRPSCSPLAKYKACYFVIAREAFHWTGADGACERVHGPYLSNVTSKRQLSLGPGLHQKRPRRSPDSVDMPRSREYEAAGASPTTRCRLTNAQLPVPAC
ncbi:hypothetical protein PSPO01_10551 [Paraphaeosphaeria sporulosa]